MDLIDEFEDEALRRGMPCTRPSRKKIHLKTKYSDEEVSVSFRRYGNGRIGINFIDHEGVPHATGTVNVPEVDLAPNEVIIKDYSENEGVEASLVAAGIIEVTERVVLTGHVACSVSKLTLLAIEESKKQGVLF